MRGRYWIPAVGTHAIVTLPRCACPVSRSSTSAAVRSASSRRACGRKLPPTLVSATERVELEVGKSQLALRPDRVVFQDVLGQTGLLQFMQTGRERVAVPATIHCDHLIQARVEGVGDLRASLEENREVYDFLRSAAA